MHIKYLLGFTLLITSCGSGTPSGSIGIGILPSLSLNMEPQSIPTYSSSSMTWSSANVDTCIASGDWEGAQNLNGSKSLYYAAPKQKTFSLTCSGKNGEVTASVNLSVSNMNILDVPERISIYSEN